MSEEPDINSWQDLYSRILSWSYMGTSGAKVCLRGQSSSDWKLEPSIYRGEQKANLEEIETKFLRFFDRDYERYTDMRPDTIHQKYFLMQHYGFPTRCLDWTLNPLVSAYFACRDNFDKHGVIYILELRDNVVQLDNAEVDYFNLDSSRVIVFEPYRRDIRMVAQDAVYSFQTDFNETQHDIFTGEHGYHLQKHVINKGAKRVLLKIIRSLGIHGGTLFPDLSGIGLLAKEHIL